LILNHLASLVLCASCSESVDALFTEAANRRMRCASAFSSAASIAPAWLSSWCSRRRYGYHTWQSSIFWASCCPCMTRPAHILSPACALLRRLIAGKVLMDRAPFAPDNLRDERWAKPSPENCVGNSSVTCSRRKSCQAPKCHTNEYLRIAGFARSVASGEAETRALIKKWHHKDRLRYVRTRVHTVRDAYDVCWHENVFGAAPAMQLLRDSQLHLHRSSSSRQASTSSILLGPQRQCTTRLKKE
jgi:hypothetical protein